MSYREQIIARIKDIPSIPASASNAINLLQDSNVNIDKVIKIIEFDPGVTANLLKLVNSSRFSTVDRKITSIKEAVVRIGASELKEMLIGSSMGPIMNNEIDGYDVPPGELWKAAVASGICTEIIADELNLTLPTYAFTAGLLHDIGKVVLGSFIKEFIDINEVIEYAVKNKTGFSMAEKKFLGIDHAEAGAIILKSWNLPEELYLPVKWHHDVEDEFISSLENQEEKLVIKIIHLADAITMLQGIGTGNEGLNYKISDVVANEFDININKMEMIICRVQMRLSELGNIFE